jgi:hypothetical protein
MGKLLDQIKNSPSKTGGAKSGLDTILNSLEKQDQQDLLVALADETIQSTVIAKVLNERGFEVSRQSVGRFRVKHL